MTDQWDEFCDRARAAGVRFGSMRDQIRACRIWVSLSDDVKSKALAALATHVSEKASFKPRIDNYLVNETWEREPVAKSRRGEQDDYFASLGVTDGN